MLPVTVMSTVVKAPHGPLLPTMAEAMLMLFNTLGMRRADVSAGPVVQLDPSPQDPDAPPTRVKLFPAGSVAFVLPDIIPPLRAMLWRPAASLRCGSKRDA